MLIHFVGGSINKTLNIGSCKVNYIQRALTTHGLVFEIDCSIFINMTSDFSPNLLAFTAI